MCTILSWILLVAGAVFLILSVLGVVVDLLTRLVPGLHGFTFATDGKGWLEAITKFIEALSKAPLWLALFVCAMILLGATSYLTQSVCAAGDKGTGSASPSEPIAVDKQQK